MDIPAGTPIYIGSNNIEHIKSRHAYEYGKYFPYISNIISAPNYVGKNPSDESIPFVKFFQTGKEYVRVAVRVTTNGTVFAKTLHLLSTVNAERYIEKGTLKTLGWSLHLFHSLVCGQIICPLFYCVNLVYYFFFYR